MAALTSRSLRKARNEHSIPCKDVISFHLWFIQGHTEEWDRAASLPGPFLSGTGQEVEEGGCGEGMKVPRVPCLTSLQSKERLCRRPHVPGCAGECVSAAPRLPTRPSDKVMRCKSLVCLTSCCPTAREPGVLRGWERRLINAKRHSLMWQ